MKFLSVKMSCVKTIITFLIAMVLPAVIYSDVGINIKFEPLEIHSIKSSNNICIKKD